LDNNAVRTFKDLIAEFEKHTREKQKEWEALPEEEKKRIFDEQRRQEETEKREALIASYHSKGIPPRFYDVSWDKWISDTDDKLKTFHTVKDRAWKTNLFLCGKSGTGKTHLAMCLTKDGATYKRLPDIFREVRLNFDGEQEIINRYGSAKLLIIDEVGRQKFSSFEHNLFFEIIDKRWNNVLPTTLVTNQSKKEFFAEYGTSIIDRLRPVIVNFNWESYRENLNISASQTDDDIDF
jgi:DNA replication protein DnaC